MFSKITLLSLIALLVPELVLGYNILFMGPFPAPSHWMWLEHFQRDLLKRGHHVTSVNNHPTKHPHANLTELILDPKFDIPYYLPKENIFKMRFSSDFENMQMWWHIGLLTSEHALNDAKVKALIASNDQKFDLVILEQFFHESFLMFAHKFNCPLVTIGTMGYADNMDHAMGLVTPWSVIPHLLLSHTDHMTFLQRTYNVYLSIYDNIMRSWFYIPKMQEMAEKHFGKHIAGPLPSLRDLEKNISLMLINSHRSTDLPRPSMPGLLDVGGAHIQPVKPLPHDLQQFLDSSTNGVVYFSLGSYVKSTDVPQEKINLILQAFSKLKQNVLWKYENESIGHLPTNVMIKKWMPQNDILAHRNVKVFITHGGLFGTQEGIFHAIPMLCIPLYGDQHRNTVKSVRGGYARSLVFADMTTEDLVYNIQLLIHDPKYKRKALEVSAIFKDNPMHPLDEASFWIEYIMRHKGAPYLKSYGASMPLYQYLLLDVLTCALFAIYMTVWVPIKLIHAIRRYFASTAKATMVCDEKKRS
ncbi:UDP-glycosyltransferase UGT5-like [Teleopsis dalmanni]|uniref:UDP-glycosyltransferase UGT5-like n=1 Tax=Teleopsis dalmanni TaxID=139649 RepID=UPI0018CFC36E|nr:UDP-glycosyltransferase UGT5-like [Teleopsis dalmanni]